MAGSHDSAEAANTSAASIKSASQTAIQAGTHSATLAYLKAVKAAGTKDTETVAKKLKELPVDDQFAKGKVLENGRMVDDLSVVPGDKAFPAAKDSGCSGCPLVK
jgi:branched-chain amino acid transport system substrate-binding protein